ncbi:MAG: DUF3833 domain-containing protein [Gammaproteobacteria bacterium]|nr:DUF3833 domain-containing protein [Gammaproteobacteria bacterium]
MKLFINSYLLIAVILSGCSVTLNDYASTQPQFDLKEYFNGQLKAYGIIQNLSGKVIRRFTVDLHGLWTGDSGVLKEVFTFDDGELQHRIWHLERLSDGSYQGTASDVIGTAIGHSLGFAFHWRYALQIDLNGKKWTINLDDWLFQLDNTRVINRTQMTKWGIKVGEITLIIEKSGG